MWFAVVAMNVVSAIVPIVCWLAMSRLGSREKSRSGVAPGACCGIWVFAGILAEAGGWK